MGLPVNAGFSHFPSQNSPAARGGDSHQGRAFEKSTSYGDVKTRNWLTVPSHPGREVSRLSKAAAHITQAPTYVPCAIG